MKKSKYSWVRINPQWRQTPASGKLAELRLKGKTICLIDRNDELFAIGGRCPHAGGPLAAGFFNENGWVVCPWHRIAFDPATGNGSGGGCFVDTYPLKKEGNLLFIGMPKPWWTWN